MRLSIVLTSSALLGVCGCKVDAPMTAIDYPTPPTCPAETACYTVDPATCVVTLKAACTAAATDNQVGPCAGNQTLCAPDGACVDDPRNYRPSPEVCDDLDNDCNGTADEGCDEDDDQRCASAMLVIGAPATCLRSLAGRGDDCNDADPDNWRSCATCVDADDDGYHTGCDAYHVHQEDCDDANPDAWGSCASCADADGDEAWLGCDAYTQHVGPDCDDADARRSPAFAEVCFNNVDDSCNDAVDENCPSVAVSIARTLADLTLHVGGSASLTLGYHAPLGGSRPSLHTVVTATNGCDGAGLTAILGGASATLELAAGASATLGGCTYRVSIADGGGFVFDGVDVAVVDDPPVILRVDRASYDTNTGHWRIAAADGVVTTLGVHVADSDTATTALSVTWKGGSVSPATSSVATDGATSAAITLTGVGTLQAVTVQVGDGAQSSAAVIIDVVVEPCVYVSTTVSGRSDTGVGAGDTPGAPMATMAAAEIRAWTDEKDLCIVGDSTFGSLVLNPAAHPGATRTPSVRGGFVDPGSGSSHPVPVFAATSASVIAIGSGYRGSLVGLRIVATAGASRAVLAQALSASPIALLIADSELTLTVTTGSGDSQALEVVGGPGMTTDVTMSGGKLAASSSTVAVAGARVSGSGASLRLLGLDSVTVSGASASLRGVVARNGASLTVQQVKSIDAKSTAGTSSLAVGVDVLKDEAAAAVPNKIAITGNGDIRASCPADLAAGIRLNQASDVTIADNDVIAIDGIAPQTIGAAIADVGAGFTGGMPNPGNSSAVKIRGNRAIVNLAEPSGCAGTLVPAGILLAGTTSAQVSDNGRAPSKELGYGGIVGAAAVASGSNPPGPAGVWLINTSGAQVTGNEIRAGYFDAGCPVSGNSWTAFGYRESTSGSATSVSGAVVDRNVILCAPALQASASSTPAGCSAVYVDNPTLANGPLLTNNVAGGSYGKPLVGLAVRGGSKTRAYNNAFDVGDDANGSGVSRTAVDVDRIAPGGLDLGNNLLLVRGGVGTGALAYRETVATGTTSSLASLQNNVLFIAGDDVVSPDTPTYAVVATVGGATSASYPASQLELIDGVTTHGNNLVADPLLIAPADAGKRGRERLSPFSPARHRGLVVTGVPLVDIDGQSRPGASTLSVGPAPIVITGPNPPGVVDVGHDEYVP